MRLQLLPAAATVLLVVGALSPCDALSTDLRERFAKTLEAKLAGRPDETRFAAPENVAAEPAEPAEPGRKLMKLRKARTMAKELRAAITRISPQIHKVAPMDMSPAGRMAAMEHVVKAATDGIAEKHGFSDFVLALEMLNAVTKKEKDTQIANHLREISALIGAGEGTGGPDEIDEIPVGEAKMMMRGVRDVLNQPSAKLLLQTTATASKRVRVLDRLLKKVLIEHNFHEFEDAVQSASAAYQDSQDGELAALMQDVGALLAVGPAGTADVLGAEEEEERGEDEGLDSVFLEEDDEL